MLTTGVRLPANTGYESQDFAPIGTISSTPIVLMAHPSLPAKSLADVIAMAKKEPGKLSVGTPPPPTLNYFAAELMKVDGRRRHHDRHLQGDRPADQRSGRRPRAARLQHHRARARQYPGGKDQAIAVAAPKRSAALPDVPTAAEAGLPGFEAVLYYGHRGAGRHAAPDHRAHQQGDARDHRLGRDHQAHRRGRRRPGAEHARGICRDDRSATRRSGPI